MKRYEGLNFIVITGTRESALRGRSSGTDRKRHLAGSIHWRTGQVFLTEAAPKQGRDGKLFIQHLDE
jgi:hypothetical protein